MSAVVIQAHRDVRPTGLVDLLIVRGLIVFVFHPSRPASRRHATSRRRQFRFGITASPRSSGLQSHVSGAEPRVTSRLTFAVATMLKAKVHI